MAAGAVLCAAGLFLRPRIVPRLPLTVVAILAFLAAQAISIPFATDRAEALRAFPHSWILLFPVFFWILLADPVLRSRGLRVLAASAALAGLLGIVQHFTGRDLIHGRILENYGGGGSVAVGSLSDHLTYAGVILPVFFLAIGLAGRNLRFAGLAFLIGCGLLFSFTRTAWIGAASGLLLLGALRGRRALVITLAVLAVVLGGASVIEPAIGRRLLSVLSVGDDPRARLWESSWRIFRAHPWIGAGLGSFQAMFAIFKVPGAYMSTAHPHNDFLNVLVETGAVGGLLWLGIWVTFFLETRNVPAARPEGSAARAAGHRPWMPDALRAGIFALLIAGAGQCFTTDEEVAEIWWFLVAAAVWETAGTRRARPGRALERKVKGIGLPLAARLLPARPTPAGGRPGSTRILVIRQDNRLGNLLLLTPMLTRLREAAPDATIGLLSGEAYAALTAGWPWLDERIVQEKRRQARNPWLYPPWLAGIRAGGWDLAIEASNHNTHSFSNCLLALASGAPERIGFDHPRSRAALTLAVAPPGETLHFSLAPLGLLRAAGFSAPAAPMSCPLPGPPSPGFAAWRKNAGAGYTVLHLGGRGRKAWPMEAWAALVPAAAEIASGPLVLVAGPQERARLAELSSSGGIPGNLVYAPELGLRDLALLLRDAEAFLGCDGGVMHLAVALGTPTVALFFCSNPWHYAPLGTAHRTVLLADPYGAANPEWETPVEGMERGPLVPAVSDPVASRAGIPEAGRRGVDAAAGALAEVLAKAGSAGAARS